MRSGVLKILRFWCGAGLGPIGSGAWIPVHQYEKMILSLGVRVIELNLAILLFFYYPTG